jgi:hypothetical protein
MAKVRHHPARKEIPLRQLDSSHFLKTKRNAVRQDVFRKNGAKKFPSDPAPRGCG